MSNDISAEVTRDLALAKEQLDAAREVVHGLANELADVVDVIEPILADHIQRIRRTRLATLQELREITAGLKEVKTTLTDPGLTAAIATGERFVAVMEKLEEFRACGFLDSYLEAFRVKS